jgi:hypothetical protein
MMADMTDPTTGPIADPTRADRPDLTVADSRTRAAVIKTESKDRSADLAADRALRTRRAEADLRRQEQADLRADRDRRRADRRARSADLAKRRRAWVLARIGYARHNAPAVYSSVIYGLAVGGAVYGQVSAATHAFKLPWWGGVMLAGAIEGTGLAMALTAQQQRMHGERALAARTLTWAMTTAAVCINYFGHRAENKEKAIVLALLSAIGIVVWEIRSGAKHRPVLREKRMIPEPQERFGWRRWVTAPGSTFEAWRVDVLYRVSPRGAELLNRAADLRRKRANSRELRRSAASARRALTHATRRGDERVMEVLACHLDAITALIADRPDPIVPVLADPAPQVPVTPKPDPRPVREPQPRRTPDPTPQVRADPAPQVRTGPPQVRSASPQVSDIGSARTTDEVFVAAVRKKYQTVMPTWAQVRNIVQELEPDLGLKPSKSRYGRVHKAVIGSVSDDQEDDRAEATG